MAILENGTYRAKAVEAKLGLSQNGNEQVGVRFALLDREGESITWYGTFTEAATEIALRGLRAAGWKGDDLSDLSSLCNGSAPEVELVVERETYQDKTRAKVKFINSAGGLAMKQALGPEQAKAFAERMRAKVLVFNQAVGKPAEAKPKRNAAPGEPPLDHLEGQDPTGQVEDIPF